jgi:hypothetical protein
MFSVVLYIFYKRNCLKKIKYFLYVFCHTLSQNINWAKDMSLLLRNSAVRHDCITGCGQLKRELTPM